MIEILIKNHVQIANFPTQFKIFYHPVLLVLTLFINLILDYANPKNDNKKSDTLFIKNQKKNSLTGYI